MLRAGRVTEAEAERVRRAADSHELDEAVGAIRLRHARELLDESVEDGSLSRQDADALLERLRRGEDPRLLRGLRGRRRPGRGATQGQAHG